MGKDIVEFTDNNFKDEVMDSKKAILVDFWALWCGPCKAIAATIDELAGELKGKVKVGKLNVDENPQITNSLNILNIPTLIFFKDGKEEARMVGINSKEAILKKIQEMV